MFEFLRKYRLNKAKERLEEARAEIDCINGLFRRVKPTVGYVDDLIKAKRRAAKYACQVDALSEPPKKDQP